MRAKRDRSGFHPASSRVAMLAMALAIAVPGTASRGQTSSPATQSLTDQVMARAKRLHELLDLLKNKDQAVQMAALQLALKDPDPVLRDMAISTYLKRFNALTPEVMPDEGSRIAPEDVPRLAMVNLRWSEDGMSFEGNYSSNCGYGAPVRGQIAGGKLAINYDGVCLRPALLGTDTGNQRNTPMDPCVLTLTPDAAGDSLDGPLHCIGVSASLPVRLPFGS